MVKCNICGEEFDSERGLHIHQSQKHGDEDGDGEKVTEEKRMEKNSSAGINLNVKQFGGITFTIGLLLGVILGGAAVSIGDSSMTEELTVAPGGDTADTGDQAPSPETGSEQDDGLVRLESGEYPYGDLEAGIGEGERQIGDKTFDLEGEPYIGSPEAEVTAVSFEDFECPFCKQYNDGAYQQIKDSYVASDQVQYFYKHLPLSSHPAAEPTALASECALNQDAEAFWTFKEGFFEHQEKLVALFKFDRDKFDQSMYEWAEQTGLDTEQFKQCYDNEEELEEVQQDKNNAQTTGATSTPTIFINDNKVVGAQPFSQFKTAIETQLD